jgi:DNA polymerase-1
VSKTYIADLESDGFLEEATKVWCGSFISLDGKERVSFYPDRDDYVQRMLTFMDSTDCLIFHNGFGFDFPLLKKLYNYEYKGEKKDTLVMSRLFNPKRMSPFNCPNKKAPHSVEAWGYRVGRGKVEHEDWTQFSENMLKRNQEDVEIQRLVYLKLIEEGEGYNWNNALKLTTKLFEILNKQEQYGWLVDKAWLKRSVSMLDHWMKRIDNILSKTLPLKVDILETLDKESGSYSYVKEPFTQAGRYNVHVSRYMLKIGLDPDKRTIGGPFSRINIRRLSLDKPDEIKDYLLENGWEPAEWNENDQGVRTSPKLDKNDPFDGIEGGVGKLVAKYIQCKSRRSILLGWEKLIREDGRIPSVVSNLAETGRATHKYIVNVPNHEAFFGKWMRKCFSCKKGFSLVGTDSAGCQNRMLAARVGDPKFTDTLLNGKKELGTSIHQVNQKAIKNIAGFDVSYGKAKNLNYASLAHVKLCELLES